MNNGKVTLAARTDGHFTTLKSKPIKKRITSLAEATISKDDKLSLKVNNRPAISKKAYPFKTQPGDSLSVGKDSRSKVAPYKNEEFQSTIKQLLLQLTE